LNIFNDEKSVGGHVKQFITLSFVFSTESHFTWQLNVEGISKLICNISN